MKILFFIGCLSYISGTNRDYESNVTDGGDVREENVEVSELRREKK